ncbi:MFS transporter [Frankia sp. Ag45/Mut15]|uniref:MFS transporter n=1 Tax=Frankia umida TaxID=573489 RepID=A0ABT0K327_9ACTN|nr:MFS transporter [Frankia umida]MCK9878190.1 MFS transporter [Frankia umida]
MDVPALHPIDAAPTVPLVAVGTGRGRRLAVVLGAGGVLTAVAQVWLVPLLPALPRLTGSSATSASWLITVGLLVAAVVTPLFGRAGDIVGKRRMLLVALGVLVAGSLLCAVSSQLWLLIPGRGMQGACLAVVPLSISILRDELPAARVGAAVAMMSATVGVGAVVGIPFGALIVQYTDWHVMFWVIAACGLTLLVAARMVVRESPVREPARFDTHGAVGLAAGLLCGLLTVSQAAAGGPLRLRVLGLATATLVILVGWARRQVRTVDPLVDLRLAARRPVLMANLAALGVGFAFYANAMCTALLVQVPKEAGYGLGLSVLAGGLCLLPAGLVMAALSPLSAWITTTRGPRTTLLLGTNILTAGYLLRLADSHHLIMIILGGVVVAAGTALAYSGVSMLTVQAVPRGQTAAAGGITVLMRMVGQATCSAAVAAILGHLSVATSVGPVPTLAAFRTVFAIAGLAAVFATLAAILAPVRARHRARRLPPRRLIPFANTPAPALTCGSCAPSLSLASAAPATSAVPFAPALPPGAAVTSGAAVTAASAVSAVSASSATERRAATIGWSQWAVRRTPRVAPTDS